MGNNTPAIGLEQLISSSFYYLDKWTPDEKLKSNACFDVLRYLLCRLHDEGDGKVKENASIAYNSISTAYIDIDSCLRGNDRKPNW